MARYVKISTVGSTPVTADDSLAFPEARRCAEEQLLAQIQPVQYDKPDLIVLPEMCDIPANYAMPKRLEYAAWRGDAHREFFAGIARENRCNVAYCTFRRGGGDYFLNTMFLLDRAGAVAGTYDKNHCTMGELKHRVLCGVKAPVFQLDIGRVACAICYDLNFDVLREQYKAQKPELILFSSMYHGGLMQQVWALTCRSYFVGSISHSRPSAILNPLGETLAYSTNYVNHATASVNLDYALLHNAAGNNKFRQIKERYGPGVTVFDPGNLGFRLVTSEMADIGMADVVREFGLEEVDDLFARELSEQQKPDNRGC